MSFRDTISSDTSAHLLRANTTRPKERESDDGLGGVLGSIFGGLAGSIVPGVGTALGAGVGGLVGNIIDGPSGGGIGSGVGGIVGNVIDGVSPKLTAGVGGLVGNAIDGGRGDPFPHLGGIAAGIVDTDFDSLFGPDPFDEAFENAERADDNPFLSRHPGGFIA